MKNIIGFSLACLTATVLVINNCSAQRWSAHAGIGMMYYFGDLNHNGILPDWKKIKVAGNFGANYRLNRRFNLHFNYLLGSIGGDDANSFFIIEKG